VREVLLEDLTPLRRARLHLRVADAIEKITGDSDDAAEILAEHLWAAAPVGVARRAADALVQGATVAVRRFAYESARELLERAVQLWRSATTGSEADVDAELRCIADLMSLQRALEGHQSLIDHPLLDRARDLARRSGHDVILLRLLWSQWAGFDNSCDFERSEPYAVEIAAVADASGDPVVRAMSCLAWGIHHWHFGRMAEASVLLDESSAITAETGAMRMWNGFEQDQDLMPQPFAMYVHVLRGDLPDAPARFDELANVVADPYGRNVVYSFASAGSLTAGEFEWTARVARLGLDLDPELAFGFWGCTNQLYLAGALSMLGRVDEATALFEGAMPRFLAIGARTGSPLLHARYGHGLARAGRFEEAAVQLAEAQRCVRDYVEAWAQPAVLSFEAELRLRRDDDADGAVALLRKARDLAAGQEAFGVAAGIDRLAAELTLDLD